jgi:hypothetical protein
MQDLRPLILTDLEPIRDFRRGVSVGPRIGRRYNSLFIATASALKSAAHAAVMARNPAGIELVMSVLARSNKPLFQFNKPGNLIFVPVKQKRQMSLSLGRSLNRSVANPDQVICGPSSRMLPSVIGGPPDAACSRRSALLAQSPHAPSF